MVALAGCLRKPSLAAVFLPALQLRKVRNHLPSEFALNYIKIFVEKTETFTLLADDLFMT
jgi:hypothetical protein